MKTYIIYLHKNKINGKCYVGQTCQKPETRWGLQGNNYRDQPYFFKAIQKYGWDNFEHIILENNIPENQRNERECYWGGYYHSLAPEGYNLKLGDNEQVIYSELHQQNRSKASLLNWQSEEYRQKVSQGRHQMWQIASLETKQKMLANLQHSGETGRNKMVLCIETNVIYKSTREAERQTGIKHNNISQACNGKRQTAGKYHWKYI